MNIHGVDLSNHYIIIDANALMHKSFQRFLRTTFVTVYNETLKQKNKKDFRVFIPQAVLSELERLTTVKGSDKLQTRTDAMDGLKLAESLIKAKYVEVMRSDYTGTIRGFNDVSIVSLFVELRRHTHLALLTNDGGLATDVLGLNNLFSVDSSYSIKAIYVDYFTQKLVEWIPSATLPELATRPQT